MIWTPHVTVAAIIERKGHHLLVEELSEGSVVLNQPAGHLDPRESLLDAVVREVWEETGRIFTPEHLVGVYLWEHPDGETFLRVAFCGEVGERLPASTLDEGILDARWFSTEEVDALHARHRSPLVARCIADHRDGLRLPLETLHRLAPDGRSLPAIAFAGRP